MSLTWKSQWILIIIVDEVAKDTKPVVEFEQSDRGIPRGSLSLYTLSPLNVGRLVHSPSNF